jgi:hypothetical protein
MKKTIIESKNNDAQRNDAQKGNAKRGFNASKNDGPKNPQQELSKMIDIFYKNSPYIELNVNHEMEVKFSTRGHKRLTKIDYDNVISKLKSLNFTVNNPEGLYFLRIYSDFLDKKTNRIKLSNTIRTEIDGKLSIEEYCKTNDIKTMINDPVYANTVRFVDKSSLFLEGKDGGEYLKDVIFTDFNFSISYKTEKNLPSTSNLGNSIVQDWKNNKKKFRFINRVSFSHEEFPILVDISIVKNSSFEKTYNIYDSGVFTNPKTYEIELEIDNKKIGPNTNFNTPQKIEEAIKTTIKIVLSGLQQTNYPISIEKQKDMLNSYMKVVQGNNYNPEKRIYSNNFIGPSSFTLQIQNIVPINKNNNIPNIRENYVVTEKADGERNLLFVSEKGHIYLININMKVVFTGAITQDLTLANSILDGELILHNKHGDFINTFAVFDIYFVNKKDVRAMSFVNQENKTERIYGKSTEKSDILKEEYRYPLLKLFIKKMNAESIIPNQKSPMRFIYKDFFPISTGDATDEGMGVSSEPRIFKACSFLIKKIRDGLFEYNTDGLIFTHTLFGVGSDKKGQAGPLSKINWEYSFKWKPPEFNTIDFLVSTVKAQNGEEQTTPIFQDGTNMNSNQQINQYKSLVLQVGFSEKKHGYINPCQDVLENKLPEYGDTIDNEEDYKKQRFYPTQPYDVDAGICRIMLQPDANGVEVELPTREWHDNGRAGYEIDVSAIPPNVTVIRFYNSW